MELEYPLSDGKTEPRPSGPLLLRRQCPLLVHGLLHPTVLARIIHEGFYCNRQYVTATSLTAGGSPLGQSTYCAKYACPSRLRVPATLLNSWRDSFSILLNTRIPLVPLIILPIPALPAGGAGQCLNQFDHRYILSLLVPKLAFKA